MWTIARRGIVVVVIVSLAACAGPDESSGEPRVSAEPARWSDFLDDAAALDHVGAYSVDQVPVRVRRRLFQTRCVGEGQPNVMLVSGSGTPLENWDDVQARIGSVARVCAYDRLGIGQSGRPPPRQSFETFAEDLEGVIDALALERPLVVVGHSMGGPIAMTWATSHLDDTAGVVLVDASSASFEAWSTAEVSAERRAAANESAENPEHLDNRVSWRQLEVLSGLGGVPLVVLTHDPGNPESVEFSMTDRDPEDVRKAWVEGQRQWAQFSSRSELVTVDGAGHFIHYSAPDAVVAAVLQAMDVSSN
jgi:pimeloyl-ACP methyl ester carboxylesterase